MKELTYADWQQNPTPRMMLVWNDDENFRNRRKVIYYSNKDVVYPVMALTSDEVVFDSFKHCAEIGKTRRMTKKELSRWLREKPTREFKYGSYISCSVYSTYTYGEDEEDVEVRKDIVVREDDGEWKEPLIEEIE